MEGVKEEGLWYAGSEEEWGSVRQVSYISGLQPRFKISNQSMGHNALEHNDCVASSSLYQPAVEVSLILRSYFPKLKASKSKNLISYAKFNFSPGRNNVSWPQTSASPCSISYHSLDHHRRINLWIYVSDSTPLSEDNFEQPKPPPAFTLKHTQNSKRINCPLVDGLGIYSTFSQIPTSDSKNCFAIINSWLTGPSDHTTHGTGILSVVDSPDCIGRMSSSSFL